MTHTIDDSDQRQQALLPDKSFIVQAPAGSGKTGLLVQRYLKLLSLVDAPEEIIAITFTKKAADEMQNRILAALEMANTRKPTNQYERVTMVLANAALERDKALDWNLANNPTRLKIQTIDALCSALVRQMPLISGLGSQFEIAEDPASLYQQAAIHTLAELDTKATWSDAIATLVLHLDNDLPRIKMLIVEMLARRDQWLGHIITDHRRADMERSLVHLIEEQLSDVVRLFPKTVGARQLMPLLNYAAHHLQKTSPAHSVVACKELTAIPGSNSEALQYWCGISHFLLTKTGAWRKQFDARNGFPATGSTQAETSTCRQRIQHMRQLIQKLQHIDGLQHALVKVSQCPPARYSNDEWRIVKALCELLKLSTMQLQWIFSERSQIDFIGMAQAAVSALGPDDEPTDLAVSLDYQIKHILVDEYQDISVSQYRLLYCLTRDWSLNDNKSLFLVGDPMQSIYRFREAEVGIFIKTLHAVCFGHMRLEPLRLTLNCRSEQTLVTWFNDNFKRIFPVQDDILSGAVSFHEALAIDQSPAKDNVAVYPMYRRDDRKEAHAVVEIITRLRQQNATMSIAVLVRSRRHLSDIIPAFRKANVSFCAVDIESLGNQQAIQDLLSLTRAYLSLADRVAWFACLSAPWCGLKLLSIYQLCADNPDKTIWQCIKDESRVGQLDQNEQARLRRFVAIIEQALRYRQKYSLRKTIEFLWIQLGGPATLTDEVLLKNCDIYFQLLEKMDQGGRMENTDDLMLKVQQLFFVAEQNTQNPVQVMTIHKAKGLEFDHVILPGLGRSARNNQEKLLASLLRQGDREEELILAPIRDAVTQRAPIYDYINLLDKQKQRHEDARLLYVAATRARHSLHLLGHVSTKEEKGKLNCVPRNSSLLGYLWPAVKDVYARNQPDMTLKRETTATFLIEQHSIRLADNWHLPDAPSSLMLDAPANRGVEAQTIDIEFQWAGETIKHIGTVAHRIIQHMAEEGGKRWNKKRVQSQRQVYTARLKQLGVPEHECESATQSVIEALTNMLIDERGQWILSVDHLDRRNEYSISGLYQNQLVNAMIDRTFVDNDGVCWIIDYKISRHEGTNLQGFLDQQQIRYQPQLDKYAVLMSRSGNKKIKLGLYFPLLKEWREWWFDKKLHA